MIKGYKTTYLHLPKSDDELCNRNMDDAGIGSQNMSLLQEQRNVTVNATMAVTGS